MLSYFVILDVCVNREREVQYTSNTTKKHVLGTFVNIHYHCNNYFCINATQCVIVRSPC